MKQIVEKEFIELIKKHYGLLLKIVNIYFYKSQYKDDFLQEILVRLWKAFPRFKGQSVFSTWMYRVALNAAIDIIRKQSIRPVSVELSNAEYDQQKIDTDTESENRDKLYRAINFLPEIEKAIILLYLEEYSYKEISQIIGISENNVGVKVSRVKNKLNKILENGKA